MVQLRNLHGPTDSSSTEFVGKCGFRIDKGTKPWWWCDICWCHGWKRPLIVHSSRRSPEELISPTYSSHGGMLSPSGDSARSLRPAVWVREKLERVSTRQLLGYPRMVKLLCFVVILETLGSQNEILETQLSRVWCDPPRTCGWTLIFRVCCIWAKA